MTRLFLTGGLAALSLTVGLWTAIVASYNHQRAANLSDLQREIEILRAANDQAEAQAAVHVWGRSLAEGIQPAPSAAAGGQAALQEGARP